MGKGQVLYRILVRNPGGNSRLRGALRKYEDNNFIDLQEMAFGSVY